MKREKIFETYESNVRSYCRCFPAVMKKAEGSLIWDENNNEYIDFWCGAGALNYGHNNAYIKERLVNYIMENGITHSLDMMTVPKAEFIEYFQNNILRPKNLDYKIMFPNATGTNAVEAALKLARKATKRTDIWALMGCFHGMTLGSLALTSDRASRWGAGIQLNNVVHIPAPYMLEMDTIAYMKMLLEDDHSATDKPAAIILETVQAEGGVYPLSVEYLKNVRKLCDQYGILMIVDDIQVGCGRCGHFFSFESAEIVPDIVVLSKSIGGYGLPFALTLLKPEYDVFEPGEHNGTFRGNQLAMVTAKAGAEYYLQNGLENKVQEGETVIRDYLSKHIAGEYAIRGRGYIWGIDVGSGEVCSQITSSCFQKGVIVEKAGRDNSVVKLMPALNIPNDLLLKGLETICNAVNALV